MKWLFARLQEPSTWAGIGLIAAALAAGITAAAGAIAPGLPKVALALTAAAAFAGGVAAFAMREQKIPQPPPPGSH